MQSSKDIPLAIIGMACQVPGADNLDEFWQLLVNGRSAIGEAPPDRFNRQLHYDPQTTLPYKSYTITGGTLVYRPLDAGRCPVPARTLAQAEIGHHTICQIAADACRHAGLNPFDLPIRNAGVYIGHNLGGPVGANMIYGSLVESSAQQLLEIDAFRKLAGDQGPRIVAELVDRIRHRLPRRGPTGTPHCSTRLAAMIVSESLGLTGPAMILDAACSSALQGLAMAARGLQLGRIDMAIVGGASYYHADGQFIFSRAQAGSRRGICCPFDADADGLIAGEGYVAVVVKTLARAQADGDPIQCVIRGIGVSSDGRGKSLWAPRKEGQMLAIQRAYERGVDLARLQYIEAHATSTRIGDVTELKALAEVLLTHRPGGAKIPLGGVKANIGHTLEPAGLIGLVKAALAMQHQTIPRQINVRNLNPEIDWERDPFYVPLANEPWPAFDDGHPRRAGVNSFGIGGLNVHVVIDEHAGQPASPAVGKARPAMPAADPAQEPIAIVGAGCIFPGARTLEAFWELLSSSRDPKTDAPPDRWNTKLAHEPGSRLPGRSRSKRGGFIADFAYDWRRHKLPPNQVAKADPLQFMILDATDAALADAGYDQKPYDRTRTGVVAGTVFGNEFGHQLQVGCRLADFCDDLTQVLSGRGMAQDEAARISQTCVDAMLARITALQDETGSFTPSTLVSRITRIFDLMGPAFTIDAGHASSLAAIYSAAEMLLDRTCDMVICAAGQRAMGLITYEAMTLRGELADDQSAAPFDADARGHLPGEGAGVVLLKRLSDAQRDGDSIRGIIRGVGAGFSLDRGEAIAQAIGRARAAAGESSTAEVLLETSGCGDAPRDEGEIAAVVNCQAGTAGSQPLVVSSLVGQIGHLQGASGMASLLAAMRALDQFEVTPRLGMTRPSAWLAAHESQVRLASGRVRLSGPQGEQELLAGVNSIDTYGAAYHLVLQRGVPQARGAAAPVAEPVASTAAGSLPGRPRIVRLAAASPEALRTLAQQAAGEAERWFAEADASHFASADVVRLAIVAESGADLAEKLALAGARLGTPAEGSLARKDVFVGRQCGGSVAFLFSGQGSQYAGMLKPLVEQFPPAAEALRHIDETLARLGMPRFTEFAWEQPQSLGHDVWLTQLSLLCADTVIFQALAALGIEPACVAGHSFGEFPALLAARAWDFENAVLGTRARCAAIEAARHVRGGMLSVAAAGPLLEELCREVGGDLFPANYNAPAQTVVAGREEALDQLQAALSARKIASKRLAVPRPFHTPLMQDTQPTLVAGLAPLAIQAPRLPVLSSVTNRPVSSADEVRANLAAQMTSPVRYIDLVKQLVERGARVLVEVGPSQVLTGLNQQILAGQDVLAIAADDKTRGGLARLLAVRASLEVRGLLGSSAPNAKPTTAQPAEPPPSGATSPGRNGHSAAGTAPQIAADPAAPPILAGSPYEMGQQHGREMAGRIQGIARRYADISGIDGDDAAEIERFVGGTEACFDDFERDELRGIAQGAGVSAVTLAVYNAWADSGLTQAAAQLAATAQGSNAHLHAMQERPATRRPWGDLSLSPGLRVCRPQDGLAHALVAWPGMVGGSAGMNERGLAITSAASEAAPQVVPTALRCVLVQRVLRRASTLDEAVALLCHEAGNVTAEFCLSHSSATEVRLVRLAAGAEPQVTARRAIVSISESSCLAAAGAPAALGTGSSWGGAVSTAEQEFSPELLALAAELKGQATIEHDCRSRLQGVAAQHMGIVMDGTTAEIAFRTAEAGGHGAVSRYRFAGSRPSEPADLPSMPVAEYLARSGSVGGKAPFDEAGRACHRFVTRMVRTAIPEIAPSLATFAGAALIVGRNAVALELRKQLEALGTKAVVVPLSDSVGKTLAAVDSIWQAYRPLHLFLVTACDDDATTSLSQTAWNARRHRGVLLPYLICQRWFTHISDANLVEKASVAAASSLGGDFGFSRPVENAESGAITGLVKALSIEVGLTTHWAFRAKVIDTPRGEPPQEIAAAMLREIRAASPAIEIGYCRGARYMPGTVYEPARPNSHHVPTRGRPWLLTGGARGITAAIAHALGSRFGVKLHLVGASPRPVLDPSVHAMDAAATKQIRAQLTRQALAEKKLPADLWKSYQKSVEIDKTLRDLEAAGIEAHYHTCNVGDREAIARLLDEIRRTDGPLEGIVHGAGIEIARRFTKKALPFVDQTIAAKVDGARHLMELTRDDPLRFFAAFGSVSGRWGSIGQTDYCLASDMLAKLIDWHRGQRPDCHAVCFHWQPWAEIGMAAREETRGSQMLRGLKHLPPEEGVRHFLDELLAGCPASEVVVTDWQYYKNFHPDLSDASRAEIFGAAAAAQPVAAAPEPAERGEPSGRIAVRQLMRLVDAPLGAQRTSFAFAGPALILGQCADASALAERLAASGVQPIPIAIGGTIADTLGELQRLFSAHRPPHLFIMTGREPAATVIDTPGAWAERSQRGVLLPYAVCQQWLALVAEAGLLDRASLAAATALGGDFGFAQPVAAPEGGALSGLLKGLSLELVQPQTCRLRIKVVDAPCDEPPAELAAALIGELDDTGFDVEAAYHQGRRRVVRLLEQPVDRASSAPIERGGVWIFTGGARGITAAVAKALGRRFGLKVHLLGHSPRPQLDETLRGADPKAVQDLKRTLVRKALAEGLSPSTYWDRLRKDLEIDQTLRELAAEGVQATYHACDVRDPAQLAATLQRIRAAGGPIAGIVHGAGIQSPARSIDQSPLQLTADLCEVKDDAALNLMLLTAGDPIRYFVGFGSISGRFGTTNSAGYCLANDLLCKLIGWYRARRPQCRAVGFHWHPWGDVGMMTRPASQHTIKVFKMKMMSPDEGCAHLIDELCAGAPESEVLITDHQFRDTFFSRKLMVAADPQASAALPPAALIERVVEREPGRRAVAEIRLHPIDDPFLREHRLRGRPTLPLVVAIEALAEAALLIDGDRRSVVACRDIQITDAVRFFTDEPMHLRVTAEISGDSVACRLTSDFRNRRGQLVQQDRPHFSGRLELGDRPATLQARQPQPVGDWLEITYPSTDEGMYHGAPLRLLKRVSVAASHAVGEIHFPPDDRLRGDRRGCWLTPSAAIDACLYACGVYVWVHGRHMMAVPQGLAELRFGQGARPGERALVQVVARELDDRHGLFDFTLFRADGAVIVQAAGYRCHLLSLPRV